MSNFGVWVIVVKKILICYWLFFKRCKYWMLRVVEFWEKLLWGLIRDKSGL